MNPSIQSLDPKLAEAYNRVMGTELPKVASPPASQSGQARTELPQTPLQPQTPTFTQVGGQPAATSVAPKKGIPWWIYALAGVTFFALYTLFWVRMFNINLF